MSVHRFIICTDIETNSQENAYREMCRRMKKKDWIRHERTLLAHKCYGPEEKKTTFSLIQDKIFSLLKYKRSVDPTADDDEPL